MADTGYDRSMSHVLQLRRATPADATAYGDYIRRNAAFLAPFVPLRAAGYDDDAAIRERLAGEDRVQHLALLGDLVVGQCAISNIARAPVWLNCTIGYDVDGEHQGCGIATRLVAHVVRDAFDRLALHRVEAGTLVDNVASQRVLERCGFTRIGVSPRHVRIAGRWQDHVLYAITAEDGVPADR
jgi:ribosomal-protein-alanine N-acetyltransferase